MFVSTQDPYMLIVRPDDLFISPREVDQPLGTMVCFHRRYALGDKHDFADKDDFLRRMFLDTVGNDESGEEKYAQTVDAVWEKHKNAVHLSELEVDEAILQVIEQKFIVLPLYLYDHSGLAMNTIGFHNPWDSGQVGWIYVSKEAVLQEYGVDQLTDELLQKVKDLLQGEVKEYDAYLRGECYGFELYKNGELVDSCWGFIGDIQEACQAIREYLPDECRDMIDGLEELDKPQTAIKTLLHHARTQIEQAAKDFEHTPRQQAIGTDAR